MPLLSRLFVRTALIYLLIGFTLGALLLSHKGVFIDAWLWRLRPAHIELLLVGWTLQLALGVAFWILPRWWQPPIRGNVIGAWLAFFLINLGIWLVIVGTWTAVSPLIFAGRVLEATAVLAFAHHAWQRVVGRDG
jgi:cbb3-type cytochrome oxidase subunit 1